MRGRDTRPVARKRFGQNFLEPAWAAKVIRAIDPQPDQTFIEIGPGRGALTRELTARARALVAYEIDRDLAAELREAAPPNLTIVEGDFLQTTPNRGLREPQADLSSSKGIRVAGNLPYNVASPILFKLVDLYAQGVAVVDATVMLQREVADRLLASPGTKDYGVLTVLIRHSADVTRVLALPPGAFRPAPKVHSSLVRLLFHAPDPPVRDLAVFRTLVQAVFTRRRKTLANALLALESRSDPRSDPRRESRSDPRPQSWSDPKPESRSDPKSESRSDRLESRSHARSESRPDSRSDSRSDQRYLVSSRLTPAEALKRALIDGTRRPETLSIAEFARLADVYASVWQ
jgi:16S rRNA (adenine1518-N6/adenine1519-N6)-dimethyltransferase